MRSPLRQWAGLLLLAPLLFLVACGGGGNSNQNANTGGGATTAATRASTNSTVVSQSAGVGGAKLTDCQYADHFSQAGSTLLGALSQVLNASGSPASGIAAQAAAVRNYTDVQAATLKVVNDLRGLSLADDLKKVNDQIVSIYGDEGKQVLDAQKAAVTGDLTKAADIMTRANSDVTARTTKLRQDNKPVFDRINACQK